MPVYIGVSGVKREVSSIAVGYNGAVRYISQGDCGVNGAARSFGNIDKPVKQIEFRINSLEGVDANSYGIWSKWTSLSKADSSSYGSYSVNGSMLSVYCAKSIKMFYVYATDYVIFQDGSTQQRGLNLLKTLGKTIELILSYYWLVSDKSVMTEFDVALFKTSVVDSSYAGNIAGTRVIDNSDITSSSTSLIVGAGIRRGSGYYPIEIKLISLTVDGTSIPCKFVDAL